MKILYLKDSNIRRKEFAVKTIIVLDNGKKLVIKESCFPEGKEHLRKIEKSQELFSKYYNNVKIAKTWIEDEKLYSEFIEGKSLLDYYTDAIIKKDKDKIKELIKFQFDLLLGRENNCVFKKTDEFKTIFGDSFNFENTQALIFTFFETDPANIIFKDNDFNDPYFIDYEWFYDIPVPVSLLGFRLIQQLSLIQGFDDIISMEERAKIINYDLLIKEGIVMINNFFSYVYIDKLIDYSSINHNYEKTIQVFTDFSEDNDQKLCVLYFNTGNGYSEDEKLILNYKENKVDITCHVPANTLSVRFDPVEFHACVVSNLEILSFNGIVKYKPINGLVDNIGNIIFTNADPQMELSGISRWLKIKYNILFLNDYFQYNIINNYLSNFNEIISLKREKDNLIIENNELMTIERDMFLNSRSWRITKPLRDIGLFIRKYKILNIFVKGLLSVKRIGIKKTLEKINNYLNKKILLTYLKKNIYISKKEKEYQKDMIFSKEIKISIITPLYNTSKKFLKEMIDSVRCQTYQNWELCLADGSDNKHNYIKNICVKYSKKDNRIKYKKLDKNEGISENSNRAIEMSTGDYIGLLDHDDIIHPSALYEVMKAICNEDADFIYTDEATFKNNDYFISLRHYKPDYAIDTLRSCNYICHFSVFSKKLIEKAGYFRREFDGSQDHDLILRYTDVALKIVHIPKLMYFWRSHKNSVAEDISSKMYAINAAKNAIKEHLTRHEISAQIESTKISPSIYRIIYELKERPLVSIIIPNKDNVSVLQKCLDSIFEKTTYNNYEIIIVENNSTEDETFAYYEKLKLNKRIKVVYWEGKGFNYSELNNFGVKYTNGTQLILLNNDVEIITPEWIEEMLMYSQRNDVGAVGIKLYFPDDTIQHAGVILGVQGLASHIYFGKSRDTVGYMGKLHHVQNMSVVTAACMMIRRQVFNDVGQLSPEFYNSFNDVDLCIKIRKAGYLIVWTPFAEAYHYESKTRGYPDTPAKQLSFSKEVSLFKEKWGKELELGDPYYNCNFSLERADYYIEL